MLEGKVTQQHIDNGKRQDRLKCPISLAIADLGLNAEVYNFKTIFCDVTSEGHPLYGESYRQTVEEKMSTTTVYTNSDKVKDWTIAFDCKKDVEPFSFIIDNERFILREKEC